MKRGDERDRSLHVLAWALHAIGLVAVAGIFVSAHSLVVAPILERRQQVVAEMLEVNKLARDAVRIKTDYAKVKESLRRAALRTQNVSRRIPEQLGEKQFLNDIMTLAQRQGVAIRDVLPGMVSRESRYSKMSFRILAAGTYKQLCGLLDELSQRPRLITVSELVVTASTQDDRYEFDVTVRIYFDLQSNVVMLGREARHG